MCKLKVGILNEKINILWNWNRNERTGRDGYDNGKKTLALVGHYFLFFLIKLELGFEWTSMEILFV